MKSRILKSLLTVGLVLTGLGYTGTAALFTDTVGVENNTFTTGTLQLKLFYDCGGDGSADEATYAGGGDSGVLTSGTETGAIVECPVDGDGSLERAALTYDMAVDGASYDVYAGGDVYNYEAGATGDWSTTNNWWDGLSSPMDWTNILPGWQTHSDTVGAIEAGGATIGAGEGDLLSLGNGGTLPMSDVEMRIEYEVEDALNESLEPLDGLPLAPNYGGDRVDPLVDDDWVNVVGLTYNTSVDTPSLGDVLYVQIDRVDNTGAVIENVYTGDFNSIASTPTTIFPVSGAGLQADEVTYLQFNWEMDYDADNTYQGLFFDYEVTFTGTQ